jgi:hypothetical protein
MNVLARLILNTEIESCSNFIDFEISILKIIVWEEWSDWKCVRI